MATEVAAEAQTEEQRGSSGAPLVDLLYTDTTDAPLLIALQDRGRCVGETKVQGRLFALRENITLNVKYRIVHS